MYKYKCYTYDIHLDIRYVFDKYIIKYIFLFDFYLDKNDFHFLLKIWRKDIFTNK